MPGSRRSATVRRFAGLARSLVQHHCRESPRRIQYLPAGMTNYVFEVRLATDELVVRISDQSSGYPTFLKEQWAVARARKKGVPVPEILEVGNEAIDYPYMIVRRIRGSEATNHPDRQRILEDLGRYASLIHRIPTRHYGQESDWSKNKLSKNESWKDYLRNELGARERLETLEKNRMMAPGPLRRVKAELRRMEQWQKRPCLTHGDLRLKNVMIDEAGRILAIIDWEDCTSNIAPYWELSIALHDLNLDEKQRFLQGYGLSPRAYAQAAPALKVFNLLNYAPLVAELAAAGDRVRLEQCRLRLRGGLDLFSV